MQDHSEAQRLLDTDDSSPYIMATAADKEAEPGKAYGAINHNGDTSLVEAVEDEAIIPKGALDPVYEAKARILNRAVSPVTMGERMSTTADW